MTHKEELIIIRRVVEGEKELFNLLINEHSAKILSVVRGVVSCREDAEEIAQDVFVKAFFSLKNFRGESSFSTWLFRIAYNLAVSKVRLKKRHFVTLENIKAGDSCSEESDYSENRDKEKRVELLETLLQKMSSEDRFLIYLFYNQDKSIKEISQITGFSESNVKVKLFRVKKRIFELGEGKLEVIYG